MDATLLARAARQALSVVGAVALEVRFVRQRMRIRRWAADWGQIAADWTAR